MKRNVFGNDANEGNLLTDYLIDDGEDVSVILACDHYDGASFQLISGRDDEFTATDTDNVDDSSKTWVFANGNFKAGDVGGTFTVAGSSTSDGTYTIDTVTNGTTVVTTAGPGSDETFDDAVTVTLTGPSPTGAWKIEVSNRYTSIPWPNDGNPWTDITSSFSPTISAVAGASSAQYVQLSPFMGRALRVSFTASGGDPGYVSVAAYAKGNE